MDKDRAFDEGRFQQYLHRKEQEYFKLLTDRVSVYRSKGFFSTGGLKDRFVPKFIELVNTNPHITAIEISHRLSNESIKLLAKGLLHVKKLILDCVDLGHRPDKEPAQNPQETIQALARSNVRYLRILRSCLTNDLADVLIKESKQTKLDISFNRYVDDEHVERAAQKARSNSEKELTFLGSPAKRRKTGSDEENDIDFNSPNGKSLP